MIENQPPLTSPDPGDTADVKAQEKEEGHVKIKDEEIPIDMNTDRPNNRNNRCTHPLYSQDSTQEYHNILQDYEDEKVIKVEVKMEDIEGTDVSDHKHYKEEEIPPEISTDGGYKSYNIERKLATSLDGEIEDYDVSSVSSEEGRNCHSHSPPVTNQKTTGGNGTFSCNACGKKFSVRAKLIKHQRTHSATSHSHALNVGKALSKSQMLSAIKELTQARGHFHVLNVGRVSPGKITLTHKCGKCFSQKSYLNTHEKVHTGEKPFSCSECGKCFTDRYRLVTHHRVHTGDRPYSCTECGRSFALSSDLIRHRKVHTGERPYSCSECGRGFINKSDLIIHERIYTGDQPCSCCKWGKRFSHKSTLKSHLGTHG